MGEIEAKGSEGGTQKISEESKLKQLADLYILRNSLEREKMRLRAQSCSDKIKNGVDSLFEGFNKKAMEEFNKKTENRTVKEEYKTNLERVKTFFDSQIKQLSDDINDLRHQREALLLSQKSYKDTIKRMQKSIAQFKSTDNDESIKSIEEFRDLLNSTKVEATALKNAQLGIKKTIEKIDKEILKKEADREKAYNDRESKIEELKNTKENSLQKRSFVSRIVALFGGGAKQRAEALAKSIEDRNQASKDAKSQLDLDYKEAEQNIQAQKEEIKTEVENSINDMKNAVVGFGKNVVGFGAKVLEYIGATFELIGTSAKGTIQNTVKKVLDRLQDFSSQEAINATNARRAAAKGVLRGENKEQDAVADASAMEP